MVSSGRKTADGRRERERERWREMLYFYAQQERINTKINGHFGAMLIAAGSLKPTRAIERRTQRPGTAASANAFN